MKAALDGQAFDWPEKLLDAITTFPSEIQVSELKGVFQHWAERVRETGFGFLRAGRPWREATIDDPSQCSSGRMMSQ
jgi:hypothetical protein